ncbi:cytochrome c oxidase subunit 3 [Litchfieldella rifensis]|uniref:Cytochrome c oxidase subunit 3 n=1 Tax=Litchfieldella rifensis TaxID=762643 RepID=A0ABV7LTD2_9GAMM
MTVSLVFLTILMAVLAGWLLRQSFNVRPWEPQSAPVAHGSHLPPAMTAGRVGLVVFLAVATSLFALTISAYMMRMHASGDWRPLPIPGLLWFNTGALLLGSIALQWAWNAVRRNDESGLTIGLMVGGACSLVFILGQLLVWYQLSAAGYYMAGNPANSFFFMLTALHGLHLLGGLIAWGRLLPKVWRGVAPMRVCSSVELCALYWHYLFAVWIILFGLVLSG